MPGRSTHAVPPPITYRPHHVCLEVATGVPGTGAKDKEVDAEYDDAHQAAAKDGSAAGGGGGRGCRERI